MQVPKRFNVILGLVIAAVTLLALEFVLGAVDRPPLYFPPPPEELFETKWAWTCDEIGCRYAYDAMIAVCEGPGPPNFPNRRCVLNRHGFHDTQEFAAGDDLDGRMRILMLGDSFAWGMSSGIGESYVETIEANFPQSIVWNTGIPGAGTHQALELFRVYAPILQPQLTILGFYVNDFGDNVLPVDIRQWLTVEDGRIVMRRYDNNDGKTVTLDEQKAYYYRAHGLEPPANEIERVIGRTRLGSLLLRMMDIARRESPSHGIEQEVEATRRYLRALRDSAAAQDTALLVLLIPHPYDVAPPPPASRRYVLHNYEYLLRHPPLMAGERYRNGMQLMEELRIPYLNPVHLLDGELDYRPLPDIHWNSAGHQKIGAVLNECIGVFQVSGDLADCEQVKMP